MSKKKDVPVFLDKTTAEGKGFRTFFQTAGGTVVAFLYGLWQLPGVSDYVNEFVRNEGFSLVVLLIATIGVPSGVLAWFMNRKR